MNIKIKNKLQRAKFRSVIFLYIFPFVLSPSPCLFHHQSYTHSITKGKQKDCSSILPAVHPSSHLSIHLSSPSAIHPACFQNLTKIQAVSVFFPRPSLLSLLNAGKLKFLKGGDQSAVFSTVLLFSSYYQVQLDIAYNVFSSLLMSFLFLRGSSILHFLFFIVNIY